MSLAARVSSMALRGSSEREWDLLFDPQQRFVSAATLHQPGRGSSCVIHEEARSPTPSRMPPHDPACPGGAGTASFKASLANEAVPISPRGGRSRWQIDIPVGEIEWRRICRSLTVAVRE